MTDDQLFEKWNKWLDSIHNDVRELLVQCEIFSEVRDIYQANPQIHDSTEFYDWMVKVYATAATVGVRRLIDTDSKSISFFRLLDGIRKNPRVLSRARYVCLYKDAQIKETKANLDFDEFAGVGVPVLSKYSSESQVPFHAGGCDAMMMRH